MSKKLSRELIAQKVKSDRIESIRNLNLWGSNIEDISIIEEMPSLEIVSLSVNKIRTLRPFANLQNLRELYLRQNLISNLNEIKYLTECQNLSVLWLSQNPICDNPNYRAVVICVLPQLQKLDDIAITQEERDKAEKKLSGNFSEEDEPEVKSNQKNMREIEQEEERYSPKKKNMINASKRKSAPNYQKSNKKEYEEEDNYYGNKNQLQRNKNKYEEEEEDYIKPKKTFQPDRRKHNDDYGRNNDQEENDMYNYDHRPIRAASGVVGKNFNLKRNNNFDDNKYDNKYENRYNNKYDNKYDNKYENRYDNKYDNNYDDNRREKKKGNSNVLNVVINLLKELSTSELQTVKREIDRINNY